MSWFSCKGACAGSDPTSDTVKVDLASLAAEKENEKPASHQNKMQEEAATAEVKRAEEEQRKEQECRQAEEQAKKRREEEQAARIREEKAAAERRAAEEAARVAAEKARQEQERLEAQRVAEEKARQEREAAEQAAIEAQRLEEERAAQEQLNQWCKANGFADMSFKKKSFLSGARFPLHEAVAKKNEEMVGLLIRFGADTSAKNSSGKTALELAQKMNKNGSMDAVIAKLQ